MKVGELMRTKLKKIKKDLCDIKISNNKNETIKEKKIAKVEDEVSDKESQEVKSGFE